MLVNYRSSPIHFFTVNTAMVKRNASVARCAPNPARLSSINLDLRSVTPAAVRLRLRPEQCCHLQLLHGPITAGTIPNENTAFTTCVDPISPPCSQPDHNILQNLVPVWHLSVQAKMVEAPGTAPGSALLIPQHVYRPPAEPRLTRDAEVHRLLQPRSR